MSVLRVWRICAALLLAGLAFAGCSSTKTADSSSIATSTNPTATAEKLYAEKEAKIGPDDLRNVEKSLLLQVLDR